MDTNSSAGGEAASRHPVIGLTYAAWCGPDGCERADVDLPLDLPPCPPPAPPVDDAPTSALHDDRLWALARRGPGAVLCLEFELHTRLARQVFRRDFAYVSRQMVGLEASRRVQRLDRATLDDALRSVRQRSDELQALFDRLARELDALPVRPATADVTLAIAAPMRLRATILSPATRRFVELLQAADRVACRAEHAWLLGALPPWRRTEFNSECRRALAGFKELVRAQRAAVGQAVREANARPSQPPSDA